MPQRLAKKLLIVGWDAADWKLIDQLLSQGLMPAVRGLLERGSRGDLNSLDPKLSPLLWTSIATGKTADAHGILHFVEADPEGAGIRISSSASRKCKALWNILTQSGLTTHVAGWYATHPAEPIKGVCVSNRWIEGVDSGNPEPAGAVHPAELAESLRELRLASGEITAQELSPMLPRIAQMDPHDKRIALLAKQVAHCASIHNAATWLLSEKPDWDCMMVFYDVIDVVGHHFMQYYPPRMPHVSEQDFDRFRHVMPGVYQLQDAMLAKLLELAGDDVTVILLSDHGFHSDHLRPPVPPALDDEHAAMDPSWHRPHGVLAMAGPGVRAGETVYGATLLDIAPTALTMLGLPIGADMDGRVLLEGLDGVDADAIERVFSWDDVHGEAGQLPSDARQDPLATAEALQQLVELGYLPPMTSDVTAQIQTVNRETRFNLGAVHVTRGRVREAAEIFEKLSEEKFEEPRYTLNHARCRHMLGKHRDAADILRRFLAVCPGHADAKVLMGAALFAEGSMEEAGAAIEEVERAAPERKDLACLLGEAYIQLERWDEAERQIERALEVNPHDSRAHHARATLALRREQFEEAAEHALSAVDLQHFFPDAHYTLGVALTWMKDFEHAIQSFRVAVSMAPGMIDAHRYLASIYRLLGDRENAPRHRDVARQLMVDRAQGQVSVAALQREAPMGPQEWAKRMGAGAEE